MPTLLTITARYNNPVRRRTDPGRLLFAAALLLFLALGQGMAARAQSTGAATTFSTSKREFKVGILLLNSTILPGAPALGPENPDPYVFFIADSRSDVKPQNWELVNPLAPATVTDSIKARWDARMGAGGYNSSDYQIGQKVTKDMACYWEVSLSDTSVNDLLKFDLLFITNHRRTAFNPLDRERLRKLVDAGGVVWLEDCGNMRIGDANGKGRFFLEQLQFSNTGSAANGGPVVFQPQHPILNSPYQLTPDEIANLGDKNYANFCMLTATAGNPNGGKGMPNPETLINIVGNKCTIPLYGYAQPYIAAGFYGSGAVLATSSDSGCDINDYVGGTNVGSGGNSGSYCGTNLNAAHTEDLKFVYNAISWGGANNSFRRNNRRTGSAFESLSAPLLTAFNFSDSDVGGYNRPADIVDSKSAPLLVNGIMYVAGLDKSSGAVTVRAYDTVPGRDLDGDGNPDDGMPDLALGTPYDEIWRYTEGGGGGSSEQPSPPIFGTVSNGAVTEDRIYVTLADGTLRIFTALPRTPQGLLSGTPALAGSAAGVGGTYDVTATHGVAPAPVFYQNRIYQVEPDGRVRCLDASNGALLWQSFTSQPYRIKPTATPTLGLSLQTANTALANNSLGGTNDVMLYVPSEVDRQGNGTFTGTTFAYWVGTRNEVQRGFVGNADGQNGIMQTRISGGTGTPGVDQYWMANQFPTFIDPNTSVRVFSAVRDPNNNGAIITSAQENYEQGIESTSYTATVDTATGKVQITPVGNATPPGSRGYPTNEPEIWISIDYDVSYIDAGRGAPVNYAQNSTGVGARNNPLLNVGAYVTTANAVGRPGGGLDTAAFSPEDTLIYSASQQFPQQQGNTSQPNPLISSVFAMHEQEGGGTQLRWRFGLHNRVQGTLDGIALDDISPITNGNLFSAQWPKTNVAGSLQNVEDVTGPSATNGMTIVGSPIVNNDGLTYVMARGNSGANGVVTVLMAFKTDPVIELTLPTATDPNSGVTVQQINAIAPTPAAGQPSPPITASATGNAPTSQLKVDAQRGKVDVTNFFAGGGSFSASQTFIVRYTPAGANTQRVAVISPLPPSAGGNTAGLPVDATGQISANTGGFTPLQWYYVLPGDPLSSPTLIGDYLYYTMFRNNATYVVAVDADPASKDSTIRVGFGESIKNVVESYLVNGVPTPQAINHVRMIQELIPPSSVSGNALQAFAPPVGSQGTLAINSAGGTYAFQDQPTLIADATRLIEVAPDGSAVWTLDASQNQPVVGGDLPIYRAGFNPPYSNPTPPTGRQAFLTKPLSRPSIARRIGNGDYLIVDTGNNRVLRVDRGGKVRWSLETVVDPYGVLGGGDPTTLSNPTDVQYYIVPTLINGSPSGYEVHYIVADPGNFRVLEVADYFGADGKPADAPATSGTAGAHVAIWTTRTQSTQGRRLRYQSIQRYLGVDPTNTYYGYPYIIAVVGNSAVSAGSSEAGNDFTGGALVSLSYAPKNTPLQVFAGNNRQQIYLWGGPAALAEPVGNGTVLGAADDLRIATSASPFTGAGPFTIQHLSRPTYFQQINIPPNGVNVYVPRVVYLICDADGVFVVEATTANNKPVRNVLWMFTQDDYNRMNGIDPVTKAVAPAGSPNARFAFPSILQNQPGNAVNDYNALPRFQPTSVQLLPNGHFLITNGASGRSALFDSGLFNGESFEVDPKDYTAGNNPPGFSLVAAPNHTARGGDFGQFAAPRVQTGGLVPGTSILFLNKQVMGNPGNTNLLEQPMFSFRQ